MTGTENVPPRRSIRLRTAPSTNIESVKQSVPPLRISKSISRPKNVGPETPLRDVSPGSSRRNSPCGLMIKESVAAIPTSSAKHTPASPPVGTTKPENASSVRNFWQNAVSGEDEGKRKPRKEGEDLKSLRSSYVKNNPFLARDRESSPKLSMSPSQHRLSLQLDEGTPTPSPTKIPAPVDRSYSPRKDSPSVDAILEASNVHSSRIKKPLGNVSEDSSDPISPVVGRSERRKTVTFDQAPQVHEFDRRSSHGTTSSEHSSLHEPDRRQRDEEEDTNSRPLPSIPRPLPQVPILDSEDERPSSKESDDTDYGQMEERIRSMMERVVLRDSLPKSTSLPQSSADVNQDDIFSLYTTTNEMDDSPLSQASTLSSQDVFSSQDAFSSQSTDLTVLSSLDSQDEEIERQMALQKQSEELLQAVRSRPFSLAGLPELGFIDKGNEDTGLGLGDYMTSDPVEKPVTASDEDTANHAVAEKPHESSAESQGPPITPPIQQGESELHTPVDKILPPPDTLPSTPPASPHKHPDDEETAPSPVVPEQEATIRSRGGSKLRVRPSLSRQEANSIIARRRKSDVPPLPNLREFSTEPEVRVKTEDEDLDLIGGKPVPPPKVDVGPLLKIESLVFESENDGFGEMAVEEMERVIEAQKRGYMMRQHSKVVHASSTGERASQVQERMASSISVDWGAKRAPQNPQRKPVPQQRKPSNVPKSTIPVVQQTGHNRANSKERQDAPSLPKKNSSTEYGRLFIKVIKLKELELALPKDEPLYFSCTLDNGLHCVTTPFKLLQKDSKIDQEFELIATEKLEFMLTLQVRVNLPPAPAKPKATLGKGTLQRIFGSPKKKPSTPVPPQKDPYHGLAGTIGRDGSFSRSYIALKTYENAAYGRQFTTDIPCLNEWALEPGAANTRGREVQRLRKRPYLIGKIECQLLFVPCINSMEELPKSMSAAIRELKNAEWFSQLLWEGFLSQQGGDCQHWRRRYFKLVGASLIGYHESTHVRRATINLAKSTRVVDDRESLIETPPTKSRGHRRKSGFACDDAEGYMYLEEGFRIWFGNGEVIDFRADTREEKREWVNVLQGVVGKVPTKKEWAEGVLQRERAMRK